MEEGKETNMGGAKKVESIKGMEKECNKWEE